jgi:hypothetical protein
LPAFPCWFVDNRCGGVAASAVVPRVSAATLFNMIAARRMRERLRFEGAVSYAPSVSYEPLDAGTAHLVFHADSGKERRAELVDAFCEFFERLRDIDDAEVGRARTELLDQWTGPLAPPIEDQALAEVQRAAMDWIFGRDYEPTELLAAEATSVTAAEVGAFAREVQKAVLFALPAGAKLRPLMGKPAPPSTARVVEGRKILSNDAPVNSERLVHGTDGVTLQQSNGAHVTVRYAELGAALWYEDGCVTLIGADAASIAVEPTLWRDGPRICREIRERVPEHLLLNQGARPADTIPKPATTRWQRLRAHLAPHSKLLAFIGGGILVCSVALLFREFMAVGVLLVLCGWVYVSAHLRSSMEK